MLLDSSTTNEERSRLSLFEDVRAAARQSGCQYLAQVGNIDMGYVGAENDPEFHNRYALAVRFTFRNPEGTLTAGVVDAEMATLTAALAAFGVTVRGA